MGDRFWSHDGFMFNLHETADQARGDAEDALATFRADAGDGWPEEVEQVAWGVVLGSVELTSSRTPEELREQGEDELAELCERQGFDGIDEYELRDQVDPWARGYLTAVGNLIRHLGATDHALDLLELAGLEVEAQVLKHADEVDREVLLRAVRKG